MVRVSTIPFTAHINGPVGGPLIPLRAIFFGIVLVQKRLFANFFNESIFIRTVLSKAKIISSWFLCAAQAQLK